MKRPLLVVLCYVVVVVVATMFSTFVVESAVDQKLISEFLGVNNALRKLPNATNMKMLYWDQELEILATSAAETCNLQVEPETNSAYGVATHLMRDAEPDLTLALLTWYSEGFHYDDPSRKCRQDSCHVYTHVMRAVSGKVGCGFQMCPFGEVKVTGKKKKQQRQNVAYVVCYYENSVYKDGVEVYHDGTPCSECPVGFGRCIEDALCVKPATQNRGKMKGKGKKKAKVSRT